MGRRKKRIVQPLKEVQIINRRTRKFRTIDIEKKEIVIYNQELNEFQLLSVISASYDVDCEPKNE